MKNKRDGAIRLFGALSGVDQEYLAASEKSSTEHNTAFYNFTDFVRRHAKPVAAVLCIAVLGVSYLGYQTVLGTKSFDGGTNGASFAFRIDTDKQECAEDKLMAEAGEQGAQEGLVGNGSPELQNGAESDNISDAARAQGKMSQEDLQDRLKEQTVATDSMSGSAYRGEEMTQEQARQLAVVGAYLPKDWPAQGEITYLVGDATAGQECVTVGWTYANQWDSFLLTVENLGNSLPEWVEEALADREKSEAYDENLYEIPHADTVPAEYFAVFQDPVFVEDDFDRDCVQARIVSNTGDSGDTGTPRGRFCVLYQDGDNYVLLHFNGRGSVNEIWDMMSSIGQ